MVELNKIYGEFTGEPTNFPAIAHDKKINVMEQALGSDVNRLTSLFVEICECNRNQRDFTRTEIRRALREVAACFAIYRTYVVPERDEITDEDRSHIERAVTLRQRQPLRYRFDPLRLYSRRPHAEGAWPQGDRVRPAISAVHQPRDGKGRGRYGVLLLQPPDRDERGGRRSSQRRHQRGRLPRLQHDHAGNSSVHHDDAVDARHEAGGRCACPAGGAVGDSARVPAGAAALVPHERASCARDRFRTATRSTSITRL